MEQDQPTNVQVRVRSPGVADPRPPVPQPPGAEPRPNRPLRVSVTSGGKPRRPPKPTRP